jgi:hypothetical protein
MPPKHVKSVRQLIYWEYAKLIAGSAVGDRRNCRFVTYTYRRGGCCATKRLSTSSSPGFGTAHRAHEFPVLVSEGSPTL